MKILLVLLTLSFTTSAYSAWICSGSIADQWFESGAFNNKKRARANVSQKCKNRVRSYMQDFCHSRGQWDCQQVASKEIDNWKCRINVCEGNYIYSQRGRNKKEARAKTQRRCSHRVKDMACQMQCDDRWRNKCWKVDR